MQSSAEGVRRFFDNEAKRFDSIYTGPRSVREKLIDVLFHQVIRLRYEKTLELLGPIEGKRVLDVGCGPGHYLVELAARGASHATGVDFATEMLDLARDTAGRRGVLERCSFVSGDFLAADIPEQVDACVAIGYFEYLEDPVAHLKRMMELTHGDIVVSFPKRMSVRAIPRSIRYKLRGCFLRFYSESDIRSLARDAGLESVDVHSVSRDYLLHARVA